MEDLSLAELKRLALLDPQTRSKPKSSAPRATVTSKPSRREVKTNVTLTGYEHGYNSGGDGMAPRNVVRDRKPTRMIGEVYIGDQLQKSSKNKKPRVAVDLEAKQRVVASLVKRNASSIPIDRRSTYSSEQSTEASAVEYESGDDEEDEVEWLGQVASQLGAASATDVDDSAQRQKKEARPITRNSTASSLDGSADLKLAAGGLKSSASIPSTSSCSDKESKQSVAAMKQPPEAVLISQLLRMNKPWRTLDAIDRGSRHEYKVYDKHDKERRVGEVIVEGELGWVEVNFGEDLKKCRSSHLVVIPSRQFEVGDFVPSHFILTNAQSNFNPIPAMSVSYTTPSADTISSSRDKKPSAEKKPSPIKRVEPIVDIDSLFHWICKCTSINDGYAATCMSCSSEKDAKATRSTLLAIAEKAIENEVDSVEEVSHTLVGALLLKLSKIPTLFLRVGNG